MRKKLSIAIFAVVAILALAVSPVAAITGDFVDDTEHPFVGLIVFYDAAGEFVGRCSGSLLSSTVFLTAGHCVGIEGAETARVYFQQDAGVNYDPATQLDPVTGYPEYCAEGTLGTLCATSDEFYNYGYTGRVPNTGDAGIVILDQEIQLSEYGQLPEEPGLLDDLATSRGTQDVVFTVSGYGVTRITEEHDVHPNISYRERLMAQATLVNVNSALNASYNFNTQGNGKDRGGTCSGDSGGPVFLGGFESNLIVGITSFGWGNDMCRGTDYAFRVDQAEVLAWINSFLEE